MAGTEPSAIAHAMLGWVRTFQPTWGQFLENPDYSVRLKDDRRELLLAAIDGRFWQLLGEWADGAILPPARRTELSGVVGPLYSSAMYATTGRAWIMVMLNAKGLLQSLVNMSGEPLADSPVWAARRISSLAAIRCAVPFDAQAAPNAVLSGGITQQQLWSGRFESYGWHALDRDDVVAESAFIAAHLFEPPTPMVQRADFWTAPMEHILRA